jgi:hypothetical protein
MAFNLTRALGALASTFHAEATTATIRAQLIAVPARLARSARRVVLHLPCDWPWESAWQQLFTAAAATGPPRAAGPSSARPHQATTGAPTVEEPDRPADLLPLRQDHDLVAPTPTTPVRWSEVERLSTEIHPDGAVS